MNTMPTPDPNGLLTVFLISTSVTIDAQLPAAAELEQITTERIFYRQQLLRAKELMETGRVAAALAQINAAVED